MDEKRLEAVIELLTKQNGALAELLQQPDKVKTAGSVNTATLLFGTGGVFSVPGLDNNVITAYVRPKGLASMLPIFPTVNENPYFASLTGYTATTGAEATTPCADAPAGFMKGCILTAQFGRLQRDTQTIDWQQVMRQRNAGVNTDLTMRGRVIGIENFNPATAEEGQILNVVTAAEMITAGVNMERELSRQTWQGTPARNNAGGGYKEFPGLDVQIATGQKDAVSNVACPALDSTVFDLGLDLVGGSGRSIVEYLSMLEYSLRYNAERMGLDPATWVVSMPPGLWFELSAVWPCNYLSYRCGVDRAPGTNPIVINDNANVQMRDAMRNGNFIEINGNRYPVVTDTGMRELNNTTTAGIPAGQYAGTIAMVPLTITGNFPATYFEHLDYRMGARDLALLRGLENFWTDAGVYSWAIEFIKWCYKLSVVTERRIILRTPQLAGRIDRVRYSPLAHLREPAADSPYNYDGGVSLRSGDTKYAVWL